MNSLISEFLSMLSILANQQIEKLGLKAWSIVLGLGLVIVSVLLFFISLGFFGHSIYNNLVVAIGESMASFIAGGFFLTIAIILLIISKKIIKKH